VAIPAWFVAYSRQSWGRVAWSTSQLALMFPAASAQESIVDLWTDWLTGSDQVQMVAIAGQRLASIDRSRCRDIIQGRVDHVSDPVLLRVLALSLLAAGGDRTTVRSICQIHSGPEQPAQHAGDGLPGRHQLVTAQGFGGLRHDAGRRPRVRPSAAYPDGGAPLINRPLSRVAVRCIPAPTRTSPTAITARRCTKVSVHGHR
jgi:hypothetical protein